MREELEALVALQQAVRGGSAASVREARFDSDVVHGRGDYSIEFDVLSPSGSAAAYTWTDTLQQRGRHASGVRMLCEDPSPTSSSWLVPVPEGAPDPDAGEPHLWGQRSLGWSAPSGRFFASLYSRSHKRAVEVADGVGLFVSAFDCQARCWLPVMPVGQQPSRLRAIRDQVISFDAAEQLGATLVCIPGRPSRAVLVVFGVLGGFVCLSAPLNVCAFHWLPRSTSILLLGPQGIARLDLDPAQLPSVGLPAVGWVGLPALTHCFPVSIGAVPGASAAVLLHVREYDEPWELALYLTLVDTATLSQLHSRSYQVELPEGSEQGLNRISTVRCTRQAVAVCLGSEQAHGTRVYQLDLSSGRLGPTVFYNRDLQFASWCACGAFLVGSRQHTSVAVLDGSGRTLVHLPREVIWPSYTWPEDTTLHYHLLSAAFTPAGQLNISAMVQESQDHTALLCAVCSFL